MNKGFSTYYIYRRMQNNGEIEKESKRQDVVTDILLEVNVAREESKFGFLLEEVEEALKTIGGFPHVRVRGLMTVAPFVEDAEKNRAVFRKLYDFYVDMKPEFCKGLCKKCPENRMNSGVQGISEMYKTVVFFLVF